MEGCVYLTNKTLQHLLTAAVGIVVEPGLWLGDRRNESGCLVVVATLMEVAA